MYDALSSVFDLYLESSIINSLNFGHFQGRNADALALYFGEDPARCPFEQGICYYPPGYIVPIEK